MAKFTKRSVETVFYKLCGMMGKVPTLEETMDATGDYWLLDYNPAYGGYTITSQAGSSNPFGTQRRSATEFVLWCNAMFDGIAMYAGSWPMGTQSAQYMDYTRRLAHGHRMQDLLEQSRIPVKQSHMLKTKQTGITIRRVR